jgi:hypothetical protein
MSSGLHERHMCAHTVNPQLVELQYPEQGMLLGLPVT